jgi:aryl-alcohol dehydrogenase-like predicted oxidoreductase
MKYKPLGNTGIDISMISMGGHEYLPNHKSRGFNEDFEKAITPGYIFPGFGGENRKKILSSAYELGINFYDVTHDSEKEALGRNLQELPPPFPVYIQTRPEGFCYTYDENNKKMADYATLKAEAERILKLLQRETIDFFNLAFMKSALENDNEYLQKISYNVSQLKKEGLIRYACADTFSGENTYLKQIATESFDVVYINFNFADHQATKQVFKEAAKANMGVVAREAFMKGALFEMAKEANIEDKTLLAHAAMKWVFSFDEVTTIVYGTGKVSHLEDSVSILDNLSMSEEELDLIHRIKGTSLFKEYESAKNKEFLQ